MKTPLSIIPNANAAKELAFESCGYFEGVEILRAEACGARAYLLSPRQEPSAQALEWKVEAALLGRRGEWELVALACQRVGLFSRDSEACLAWRRPTPDGSWQWDGAASMVAANGSQGASLSALAGSI